MNNQSNKEEPHEQINNIIDEQPEQHSEPSEPQNNNRAINIAYKNVSHVRLCVTHKAKTRQFLTS